LLVQQNLLQRGGINSRKGSGGTRLFTGIALRKPDGTGNQFCQCESDISDIKTAFSEKYSDSSFTREFLQKPRNDVTDVTVKTVETGKTASNPAEETSFDNPQLVETDKTGVDKTDLAKLADKTDCQNWQADKTDLAKQPLRK